MAGRRELSVVLVALALAGCGGNSGGDAGAPIAATPVGAAATGSPLAIPTRPIPAALVGTYTYQQGGTWHVTLRRDGTYAQWNFNGDLDITGRYGVDGHVAVFNDDQTGTYNGTPCPAPGAYSWRFRGRQLVMAVKEDDCSVGRKEQWTAGWRKVSTSALPAAATLKAAEGR